MPEEERKYDDDENIPSNPSKETPLEEMIHSRMSRRTAIKGMLASGVGITACENPQSLWRSFSAVYDSWCPEVWYVGDG